MKDKLENIFGHNVNSLFTLTNVLIICEIKHDKGGESKELIIIDNMLSKLLSEIAHNYCVKFLFIKF